MLTRFLSLLGLCGNIACFVLVSAVHLSFSVRHFIYVALSYGVWILVHHPRVVLICTPVCLGLFTPLRWLPTTKTASQSAVYLLDLAPLHWTCVNTTTFWSGRLHTRSLERRRVLAPTLVPTGCLLVCTMVLSQHLPSLKIAVPASA
jgi:hypothetical protein